MYWINFRDKSRSVANFEALAVIEHQGNITRDGEGQGHYLCDIKSSKTNTWFRTNDNNVPLPISTDNVTKNGVVILYKKK